MGTTERRQREAQQRRQDILKAAQKVFWEKGFSGTTMPQVAAEAELAPGTLYLYFPSKDALYVELLVEGYDVLKERLQSQVQAEGSASERAAGLIDAFFSFAREYPEYFDIIFFVLQQENIGSWRASLSEDQLNRLAGREDECKAIAAEILHKVDFAAPEDLKIIVDAIWSMLAGVVFCLREREDFDVICAQARNLILLAVFGKIQMLAAN
jgi:AcrR family transcriptional regulator